MSAGRFSFKSYSIVPGFGITMGFTLFYLGLVVLIPLSGLAFKAAEAGGRDFLAAVSDPRVAAAFRISFGAAFAAAAVNAVFGFAVSWVLVRYDFPGKKIVDAMIDLPFALPTAVAGIALTTLYAPEGWIGRFFADHGVQVAYTPAGIVVALVFVGLPFVVRTVEPVLRDLDREMEEAAACLGAGRARVFSSVIVPQVFPALLAGFSMAFARALGEYGSVIFIAGNMPYRSEIVPLLIVVKLEQYDYAGAASIALAMLAASFALLLAINLLQKWSRSRGGRA